MRALLPALFLLGCAPGDPPSAGLGDAFVQLRFALDDEAGDDDVQVDTVALRVHEAGVRADGPEGAVSVVHTGGVLATVPPSPTDPLLALVLAPGAYHDASATTHLRPDGDIPALRALGHYDGMPFELVVTMEVGLDAELGDRELAAGQALDLVYHLEPEAWFDDPDELEPTGDRLLIDAEHNIPHYFQAVEALEDSTEATVGAVR